MKLTEDQIIDLLPPGDWEIESTIDFARAVEAAVVKKFLDYSQDPYGKLSDGTLVFNQTQLAGAVLRERERCALIAEDVARKYGQQHNASAENVADECAAAIRSWK